ncbi:MAG: DMT family transporter [Burkholderiales bacterium]
MTLPAAHSHALARALPLFLAAGIMLPALDATAKYLVRDHSVFLVLWARYAGQALFVTPFARHRGGAHFWRTRHLALQLARSACLFSATVFFFSGLKYLPLAEGSSISFMAPIFIVILAGPMLGERPTRIAWIAVGLGFAGILVLLRPGGAVFHPAALLFLAAALMNALYQLLTRKVTGDGVHTTLFFSALVGAIFATLALPFATAGAPTTGFTLFLLLLLGALAGTGHWLITRAIVIAPASLLTPFTYLQVVWATLLGYAIFGQIPDRWSFAGMAIIVGSGIMLALVERRRARRGEIVVPDPL